MSSAISDGQRAEMLRAEANTLLHSPDFVRSPVMSQLLKYLVEEAITNPDNPPKAYQVAVDGLGRTEDFDVQADSYPRVQVGRLRKMLAAHYAAAESPKRLRIPIGHYTVEIHMDDDDTDQQPDIPDKETDAPALASPAAAGTDRWFHSKRMILGLAAILLIAVMAFAWSTGLFDDDLPDEKTISEYYSLPPKIYFTPAHDQLPANEPGREAEIRLFMEHALANSSQVRLAAEDISDSSSDPYQNAYRFDIQWVPGQNGPEVIFSLTSLERNEVIWSATIAAPESAANYPDELGPIASRIASVYGVIATDQRKHLPDDAMMGHACLLRFESYRADRDPRLLAVVESCLEQSLAADPLDSRILAAASFVAFLREDETGRTPDPEAGMRFAREAMVRGREEASANFALARASFFNRNCARGKEFAEKAIELDPYEATMHAETGAFLFACSDPSAIQYLRRAIALDPRGSILAETALVFTLLAEGKDKEALEFAESIMPSSNSVGPYYGVAMAMVYAKNGRIEDSRAAWDRLVAAYGSKTGESPREFLDRLILNPSLANRAFLLLSITGVITE